MKITLVGMGSGTPGSLTVQGLNALREAELIIGARRLLESLPDGCTGNRAPLYMGGTTQRAAPPAKGHGIGGQCSCVMPGYALALQPLTCCHRP